MWHTKIWHSDLEYLSQQCPGHLHTGYSSPLNRCWKNKGNWKCKNSHWPSDWTFTKKVNYFREYLTNWSFNIRSSWGYRRPSTNDRPYNQGLLWTHQPLWPHWMVESITSQLKGQGWGVSVVVQFYPWSEFYFSLFLGMVMYDNEYKTINASMHTNSIRLQFIKTIYMPHEIWPLWLVSSPAYSLPFSTFNSFCIKLS